MLAGIYAFSAINIHLITATIPYNSFVNTFGRECIVAVSDCSFRFSKTALGNSLPPISCSTGIQVPFQLLVCLQLFWAGAAEADVNEAINVIILIHRFLSG